MQVPLWQTTMCAMCRFHSHGRRQRSHQLHSVPSLPLPSQQDQVPQATVRQRGRCQQGCPPYQQWCCRWHQLKRRFPKEHAVQGYRRWWWGICWLWIVICVRFCCWFFLVFLTDCGECKSGWTICSFFSSFIVNNFQLMWSLENVQRQQVFVISIISVAHCTQKWQQVFLIFFGAI